MLNPRLVVAWSLLVLLPLIGLGVLRAFPALDVELEDYVLHFYVVSGTAIAAAVACLAAFALSRAVRETRLLFLALGFLSMATIFAVHGLMTPGHIRHHAYAELGMSTWLSIFSGAVFVSLSAIAPARWLDRLAARFGWTIVVVVCIGLISFAVACLTQGSWLAWLPLDERRYQLAGAGAALAALAFASWRYLQSFMFARLHSQWSMVIALMLLMEVVLEMTFTPVWHLSWWMYHASYALAFLVLLGGWVAEATRASDLRVIAEGLAMRDAIAQLSRGHSQPIAHLVEAIEVKDLYTHGHVWRVAALAVAVGKDFGLPASQLRDLALAAQLHDVGKIGVPDRILKKPGPLTPDEFEVIKTHTERGHMIALSVPALRSVAETIRHHHERFDGSGYPDHLAGEAIPFGARIISVADAFDAMVSGRVYRPATTEEQALAELLSASGSHFDPDCVRAFLHAWDRLRTDGQASRLLVA